MKTENQVIKLLKDCLEELRNEYHVNKIGVFGSYIRNEQQPASDSDILVSFTQPVGFITFMRLENHLRNLLNSKVDLVTPKALKPNIGKRILAEVHYVN